MYIIHKKLHNMFIIIEIIIENIIILLLILFFDCYTKNK